MIRHSFFFLPFLLLFTHLIRCQSRFTSGMVRDAQTEEGIGFASLLLLPSGKLLQTNDKGLFEIKERLKEERLIISAVGFETDTFRIGASAYQEFRLQSRNRELKEVVVSGTMNEVQRKESILPIEVYTPTLFRKTWAPSLLESVNMINGVQPQLNCNVCSAGDIHINGLEGPYTMILIDGMPIVSSLSTVYGLSGIPQSLIKRIEVVKGPASTLYGSEAVAGLLNIITKDAGSAPFARIELSGTSIGEINLDASTKWKAGKHQSLLGINAFHYGIPKDINQDNFTDMALQKRISVFNKWDFKTSGSGKSSLAFRLVGEDRWGGQLQWKPRWKGSDSVYGENIQTRRAEVLGTFPLNPEGNLRLDYSYNYHFQDSWYGQNHFLAAQHTAFSQLVWSGRSNRISWVSGIPVRWTVYDDNTPATQSKNVESARNQQSRTVLPGLFGQADYRLSPRWTLLGGLRFDHHPVHGGIWTPRAGLKWRVKGEQNLRISGGSGFRVVNLFTEDHAALTGSREVILKNTLNPERSWNVNGGYQTSFQHAKGFSNLEINVFFTRFSNQITGDFDTDPEKIIYDNLSGYAISRGISANYDLTLESGWKALIGITWMQVFRMHRKDEGGYQKQTQLFAPPLSGTFSLSYRRSSWSFDLTGRVNGPMKLPVFPNDFRPSWSPVYPLVNLQCSRQWRMGMEFFGGIRNLLNFKPKNPIMRPFDPFDKQIGMDNPNGFSFDPSYNYAPVQGTTAYAGIRWTLE